MQIMMIQFFLAGILYLFTSGITSSQPELTGYRDIAFYSGRFVAVGTGGRIDYINASGEKTPVISACKDNLNSIICVDKILIVTGDNGIILFSADGQVFTIAKSGTDRNINGVTYKNGLFIAGADSGTVLISKNGKTWNAVRPEVRGNIESVTANDSFCIGVTDKGEIIRSYDGVNWEITDYNKKYSGYYEPCQFRKAIFGRNMIVVMGKHYDSSPAVLFSSLGNVWTERPLVYNDDHGEVHMLTNLPNNVTYDAVRDQYFLACDNGEILSLPACTKCNVSVTVSSKDLQAIICTGDLLLSAGEGFSVSILKL